MFSEIERVVRASLQANGKAGTTILCAVSGGPDSLALLYALCALREAEHLRLFAAHLHHGIRQKADEDETFVVAVCKRWNVKLFIGRADVPALAETEKKTLEQAARDARYVFLRETAHSVGADLIALGHQMDDQAETVLLNLLRGAGAGGLRGMRILRGDLFRPLLGVRRSQILGYLADNGAEYREDETNTDPAYSRNRIREWIRELERENPRIVENIARAAELTAIDDDALNLHAQSRKAEMMTATGVNANLLLDTELALRTRVIRQLAGEAGLEQDFEWKHVQDVLALCQGGRTGSCVSLPHGWTARLDYGTLSIEPDWKSPSIEPRPLRIGTRTLTELGGFEADLVERPADLKQGWPHTVYVNPGAFEHAVVRTRQSGDVIAPLGAGGHKPLKDFYIDKKIDKRLRALPIIAVGNEALWVVGGAISESARVGSEQTVLRLRFILPTDWQYCALFER